MAAWSISTPCATAPRPPFANKNMRRRLAGQMNSGSRRSRPAVRGRDPGVAYGPHDPDRSAVERDRT